jgi:hypothetical protein
MEAKVPVPHFALGLLLGGAVLAAGVSPAPDTAQISCDWASYPDFCIPPVWEVGDLTCADISGTWFTVYQPDPHGFDTDFDGYGCGTDVGGDTTTLSGTQTYVEPVAPAADCDPAYPDLCIPVGAEDLDCQYIYDLGLSTITVYEPDPHAFDGNGDGIGCEDY